MYIFGTFSVLIKQCSLFQPSCMSSFENDFSHIFLPLSALIFTLFHSLINLLCYFIDYPPLPLNSLRYFKLNFVVWGSHNNQNGVRCEIYHSIHVWSILTFDALIISVLLRFMCYQLLWIAFEFIWRKCSNEQPLKAGSWSAKWYYTRKATTAKAQSCCLYLEEKFISVRIKATSE